MAIRVALHHRTRYRYAKRIAVGPQIIRLRPAPHNRTPIHRYSLSIEPKQHFVNWQQDPHGNYLARVVIPERTDVFQIDVDLVADLEAFSPFDFFLEPSADHFPFRYEPELSRELLPYLEKGEVTPRVARFIESLDRRPRRTVDFLVDLNRALHQAVKYLIRMEPGVQTPEKTLELAAGSCRDSAWLLVFILRHLGIAARFVSGYLIQLTPDQKPVEGPPGPEKDFTDLHAWCECYVPGAGWIGLDPTSGLFAAEGHIPLACTPHPFSAAPVHGSVDQVETEFDFSMQVVRVVDRPRVTKPYTPEQWSAILALGDQVDEGLKRSDVRLSTGGEPTFVSSEDPDAPEWNTHAMGGSKEYHADRLLRRLYELWGPTGFLFHGQGKWYPDEQLPRWAHTCYFRRDGVPLWRNRVLLGESGRDYGHTEIHAEQFVQRLIHTLGLTRHGLMPAYEDIWYYMWRERRLPTNVDPLNSHIDDPLERARIRKIFSQGLKKVSGWVLPLHHIGYWISGKWFLRDEHCFLHPGDSPIGFRLPLDSVPWIATSDWDAGFERDPFAQLPPLPDRHQFPKQSPEYTEIRTQRRWPLSEEEQARRAEEEKRRELEAKIHEELGIVDAPERAPSARQASRQQAPNTPADPFTLPQQGESALGITRTALCVEPRGGLLRVFMPPLHAIDVYLELVAAVEHTAEELKLPVQLEGYPPPHDPRIMEFKVTPDPGVIEVNVPPTTSWRAAVQQTEELYEAARQEKLVAEKFDIDGSHIGSGGGNHVVLGSMTASDSPFLRRPDVLASLIRYWHNHPSLSYLFSGRFIGPTSQAPRVDEARNDAVYELELAFSKLPGPGQSTSPWLVDRILRNLLVDVTGNTHRTEFCIDKLYSPDSPTGRLGLVEMRAFEMPPHAHMSSVQQLLVRALLAIFWERPYTKELVKWGTRLHDEFMLPFYVMRDLEQVLSDLNHWGYPFSPAWFDPHYQFRFPRYGEVCLDTLSVELRGALEPWHVLGEEATVAGQARYVDSSIERLQVLVDGSIEERYRLLCNGYALPLQPTATNGRYVAGVRYRAWQPPSCLHPTIGIHSPLHFDIYDDWTGRVLAGCTYHVVHPGGRSSDNRPINAIAAESRRLARFETRGHQGSAVLKVLPAHPHFPHTLDLRRA